MEKTKTVRYIEAVGRRKSAIARVRITPGEKTEIVVNEKPLGLYFKTRELVSTSKDPLEKTALEQKFYVSAIIKGGGVSAQADALRHGISRALINYDKELRTRLKKLGFLKRDPRKKERKKYGLKKARKAPTWSKR
ncbi:MAG: 30S ribosomal protein S9 [Candidatus Lloydbacteria bacterium RIFCSPHIGHO2_01_FULL_41_20]|uniref:Small ribosomal subunit protein uS9 n=1 Tax=Candidatus Lloydbacteria bacterium RIFCSPHIGHO2_01_FULL_41_20 TaxID=1798657 RepID=A0A1G2CRD0_9BACT|nr:MAG: 30S ribosomal protein S9 [Candidatus Lloydbacteria bacterium RIFCSPHIGHO2_01_FULL_41_20]